MKKLFTLAALLGIGTIAQAAPDTVATNYFGRSLNDSVNTFWTTKNIVGPTVSSMNLIGDTSLATRIKWYFFDSSYPGQYSATFSDSLMKVNFLNTLRDGNANYGGFSMRWHSSKKLDAFPSNPFGYKVSGDSQHNVTYTPQVADTLYSTLIDLSRKPVVSMIVKSDKKVNIRIDLIDANGRVANNISPHHWLDGDSQWHNLEFRWDYRGVDPAKPFLTYEDPTSMDFNTGAAADGWSGTWLGVNNGRGASLEQPMLYGRTGFRAAAVLDLSKIAGIVVTFDDGSSFSNFNLEKSKTVSIKQITVGAEGTPVNVSNFNTVEKIKNWSTPKSLKMSTHTAYVLLNDTLPLRSIVSTENVQSIQYRSNNATIAQVNSNGTILARALGNTSIFAYDEETPSLKDSIFISVTDKLAGFYSSVVTKFKTTEIDLHSQMYAVWGKQIDFEISQSEKHPNATLLSNGTLLCTKSDSVKVYIREHNKPTIIDSCIFVFALNYPVFASIVNSTKIAVSFSESNKAFNDLINRIIIRENDTTSIRKITSVSEENGYVTLYLDKALQQTENIKIRYSVPKALGWSDIAVMPQQLSFILPRFVVFENESANLASCVKVAKISDLAFAIKDSQIATLDSNGLLIAKKTGTTTAYVSSVAPPLQRDSTTILVLPNIIIVGISVDGSGTQLEVYVNGTTQLYPGIENDFVIMTNDKIKSGNVIEVKRVMKSVDKPNVLLLQLAKPISQSQSVTINYAPQATITESKIRSTYTTNSTTYTNEAAQTEARVYPNPTTNLVTVFANELQSVLIYNTHGELLASFDSYASTMVFDMSAYVNGLYFVELITKNGSIKKTVLKQ